MQDLGIKTCRGQRYRYQTPLNLLIYKGSFGKVRVTDSMDSNRQLRACHRFYVTDLTGNYVRVTDSYVTRKHEFTKARKHD